MPPRPSTISVAVEAGVGVVVPAVRGATDLGCHHEARALPSSMVSSEDPTKGVRIRIHLQRGPSTL